MRIVQHVKKMSGYLHGEQPTGRGVIKINTNENAYPPSPKCAEALAKFDLARLRIYPQAECLPLREELARQLQTTPDRIFVGNGSDEILALAARAFVENDETLGSLDPSYSLYRTLAEIRDVKWLGFDSGRLAAAQPELERQRVALFLLTNPNAPTGEWTAPREVARFAKSFKGVVIVDEAYADFACGDCMALATAADNRNLIVMRTFSKSYSLAGLRVGYCVGPKDLISALFKIKDSYNVDALAQTVALAALKDRKYHAETTAKIIRTREWFTAELEQRGWDVIPSQANFVFARPPEGMSAESIFNTLKRQRIYTRWFAAGNTRTRIRFTIGTDAEMKKVLGKLKKLKA